jgi:hypothetical protein
MEKPVVKEIDSSLEAMQEIVDGYIQALFPFDEPVALICNEEGKLHGLPLNRALRDDAGNVYDVISGTFFLCSAPPDQDSFASLSDDEIQHFMERFRYPELFLLK